MTPSQQKKTQAFAAVIFNELQGRWCRSPPSCDSDSLVFFALFYIITSVPRQVNFFLYVFTRLPNRYSRLSARTGNRRFFLNRDAVAGFRGFSYYACAIMKKQELSPLSANLEGFFGRRQWHLLWQVFAITRSWSGIVGKEIADRSQPAYIQKNVLWVNVRDSVWMQQLHAMKPGILGRVQHAFPEAGIQDIRWRLGTAEPEAAAPRAEGRRKTPDPEQAGAFARMTSIIDNKECRDALNRLWRTFHQHGNDDELSS